MIIKFKMKKTILNSKRVFLCYSVLLLFVLAGSASAIVMVPDKISPDLVIDSIRIIPENPSINDQICIYATIKNIGKKDINGSDITVWTYINNAHTSNISYGKVLRVGEYMEKEVSCSKYGENVIFRKGPNFVWVVADPDTVNIIDESNELNNGMSASFDISQDGSFSAEPEEWDVSIKFDVANEGFFYPFKPSPGKLGERYYVKLNGDDSNYRETAYANTCPSYWDADPAAKRAIGWYAERKRMDNGDYKILIRGTAPADCGYGSPGESSGELSVNPASGWKIKEVSKCNAQESNKGQNVKCEAGAGYVLFLAGSNCGGCCACADSGGLDIEVIVGKEGGSVIAKPQGSCSDTDGGRDIFKKGETEYSGKTDADQCVSSDILKEYYCDNGIGRAVNYVCENGCESGECLSGSQNDFRSSIANNGALKTFKGEIEDSGLIGAIIVITGLAFGTMIVIVVAFSRKII